MNNSAINADGGSIYTFAVNGITIKDCIFSKTYNENARGGAIMNN